MHIYGICCYTNKLWRLGEILSLSQHHVCYLDFQYGVKWMNNLRIGTDIKHVNHKKYTSLIIIEINSIKYINKHVVGGKVWYYHWPSPINRAVTINKLLLLRNEPTCLCVCNFLTQRDFPSTSSISMNWTNMKLIFGLLLLLLIVVNEHIFKSDKSESMKKIDYILLPMKITLNTK